MMHKSRVPISGVFAPFFSGTSLSVTHGSYDGIYVDLRYLFNLFIPLCLQLSLRHYFMKQYFSGHHVGRLPQLGYKYDAPVLSNRDYHWIIMMKKYTIFAYFRQFSFFLEIFQWKEIMLIGFLRLLR